jgi:hypothetical protein
MVLKLANSPFEGGKGDVDHQKTPLKLPSRGELTSCTPKHYCIYKMFRTIMVSLTLKVWIIAMIFVYA